MQWANTVGSLVFASGTDKSRLTDGEVGDPYAG